MKNFIYILLMAISVSCSSDYLVAEKETHHDEKEKLRSVLRNKVQCDLVGEYNLTDIKDLVGIWNDTLIWKTRQDDTCYYGFEELDRHISLELKPSMTFVWTESYSISSWDFERYGEYFISNENNLTELILAENGKRDSLSFQGDTLKAAKFRLFWTDSTSLLLLPPSPSNGNYMNYEVIEFKKQYVSTR